MTTSPKYRWRLAEGPVITVGDAARIDFAADAAAAGLALRPTRLLMFGNPRAGTPVIVAKPAVALDLPLKVLVWEAHDGGVWVGYTPPEELGERHNVPPDLLVNLRVVEALAAAAAASPTGR